MMCQSLDGFMYGPQLLFARQYITADMATPIASERFDSKMHLLEKLSTYCLISSTDAGIQTGSSLLDRLKMLDKELEANGIIRPIVIMTDNHSSRYDIEVLQFARNKQIRLWTERSCTSQWAQALDQFNKQFHDTWKSGVREYKHQKKLSDGLNFTENVKIDIPAVLEIFANVWFSGWSTAVDRQTSFRKVGITGSKIDPAQINSSHLMTDIQVDSVPMTSIDECPSPDKSIDRDSVEYFKAKYDTAKVVCKNLEKLLHSPKAQGLLIIPSPPTTKESSSNIKRKRFSDQHGSMEIRDILGQKIKDMEQEKKEEEEKQKVKELALQKKTDASKVQGEIIATFELCKDGCKCQIIPCPSRKLKRCQICADIKANFCRKKKCLEAAQKIQL
eukprot:Pompholyxophrys_sp_v1_NODE_43_length_3196_cov_8.157275.p1 type:complete len:389 gc:universal NODE_43_length_3196_cov_8.157275:2112-946(-)